MRNLNLIIYCDHKGLVGKALEPLFGEAGIPGRVHTGGIWRRIDPGAIGQETISCIGIVWVEPLLV